MSLLTVDNVTAGYGDARAVNAISLGLQAGEVLALVGANGAGKTTLMRTIAGAHQPWTGRILLDGDDVTGESDYRRAKRGISLVPEGRRMFPSLTVRENLLIGASARRAGEWTLESVVDALPVLGSLLNRNASRLSGGQQQAVAIARALMANPLVLLLDEVSLGLAPIVVDDIYESLAGVRKAGLGVILVEQDLTRALGFADRALCMLGGRNVLEGDTRSLGRDAITHAYFGHASERSVGGGEKGAEA